tara:strand:+ start:367 stop:927 length:561 start_codon:yes stop_codon:yes gene_type:complete
MANSEISKKDLALWLEVTKTTDKTLNSKKKNTLQKVPLHKENLNKHRENLNKHKENISQKTKKNFDLLPKDLRNTDEKLGLEKSTIKNLKRGRYKQDGIIDLHGMNLYNAEKILTKFILDQFEQEKRNLLVISGKGIFGQGKIRKQMPIWFRKKPLVDIVYAYTNALQKDGGEGAFYIRLRKKNKF